MTRWEVQVLTESGESVELGVEDDGVFKSARELYHALHRAYSVIETVSHNGGRRGFRSATINFPPMSQ